MNNNRIQLEAIIYRIGTDEIKNLKIAIKQSIKNQLHYNHTQTNLSDFLKEKHKFITIVIH